MLTLKDINVKANALCRFQSALAGSFTSGGGNWGREGRARSRAQSLLTGCDSSSSNLVVNPGANRIKVTVDENGQRAAEQMCQGQGGA